MLAKWLVDKEILCADVSRRRPEMACHVGGARSVRRIPGATFEQPETGAMTVADSRIASAGMVRFPTHTIRRSGNWDISQSYGQTPS